MNIWRNDEVADYAAVVCKYSRHPEMVREESVVKFSNDDFNVFVMPDESAVRDAVYGGATRLENAPVPVHLPTERLLERRQLPVRKNMTLK